MVRDRRDDPFMSVDTVGREAVIVFGTLHPRGGETITEFHTPHARNGE